MCAKVRFESRKDARRAARRASITGVHPYRCVDVECFGFWHVGHLPSTIRHGHASRQGVYGR